MLNSHKNNELTVIFLFEIKTIKNQTLHFTQIIKIQIENNIVSIFSLVNNNNFNLI